nr:MAG TPA: hypothetical protein [Caudoviricetes sp.]
MSSSPSACLVGFSDSLNYQINFNAERQKEVLS